MGEPAEHVQRFFEPLRDVSDVTGAVWPGRGSVRVTGSGGLQT